MINMNLLRVPAAVACVNFFILRLVPTQFSSSIYFGVNAALIFYIGFRAIQLYALRLRIAALYGTSIIVIVFVLGAVDILLFDYTSNLQMKIQGIAGYFLSLVAFVPIAILLAVIGGVVAKKKEDLFGNDTHLR